jgi:hypothetical protein
VNFPTINEHQQIPPGVDVVFGGYFAHVEPSPEHDEYMCPCGDYIDEYAVIVESDLGLDPSEEPGMSMCFHSLECAMSYLRFEGEPTIVIREEPL